ncbi:MAG: hypothetical protein WC332_02400 [Clostridia bacterium]|jgi:hypothetical protein
MSETNFPNGLTSRGIPLPSAGRDISGSTYFVDNNSGSDSNDGSSWAKAFKTFAKATAISNIDIARGSDRWARRNTIYYCADTETATIVAFPNKCDVIGCGSYDANKQAGILGNHAPVNAGNYGTRFFNIWFKGPAVASPLVTLASTSSGIEFDSSCVFDANALTTTGITATASPFLKVHPGVRFQGAFATAYISIGAGEAGGTEIFGIRATDSAASGIVINASTTTSWGAFIAHNMIKAATVTINDASSLFHVIDNDLISLATVTGYETPAEALVCNAALASRNHLTAANVNFDYPIADTTT